MIDELKIEMAQNMLSKSYTINLTVINMIKLGEEMETKDMDYSVYGIENDLYAVNEIKAKILNNFEIFQAYLSSLNTVLELYEFNSEDRQMLNLLTSKLEELYHYCSLGCEFNKEKVDDLGQECLNVITKMDSKIREKHIELIRTMKGLKRKN